jgi:hypothetical protein
MFLRHSSVIRRKENWPATCHSSSEIWPHPIAREKKNGVHKICYIMLKYASVILPYVFCYRSGVCIIRATKLARDSIIQDFLEIKEALRQL